MLKGYGILDEDGNQISVTALDLRRTYARRVFLADVDFNVLHTELGNVNYRTTLEYIGLPKIDPLKDRSFSDASVLLTQLSRNWGSRGNR